MRLRQQEQEREAQRAHRGDERDGSRGVGDVALVIFRLADAQARRADEQRRQAHEERLARDLGGGRGRAAAAARRLAISLVSYPKIASFRPTMPWQLPV